MNEFFDLHCDTASELSKYDCKLFSNGLDISLEQAERFDHYLQTFAFWTENDDDKSSDRFDAFIEKYSYFLRQVIINSDRMMIIANSEDIRCAELSHKVGALLSIEGGGVLEGNVRNLSGLYKNGIRMMSLTWNYSNELCCGVLENNDTGLTDTGASVVREMNRLGMIIDLSHISDKGFWDVCKITDYPFVISHSNSRSVTDNRRNITDDMVRETVNRHGLIGINLYTPFLTKESKSTVSDIIRHIDHFLECGAEDVISFGCDFDGADGKLPENVKSLSEIDNLKNELVKQFGEEITHKIMYDNARRFFYDELKER